MEPQSVWTNEDPRLHLLSWDGEGLPLILLHGMAGNAHWWDRAAAHLCSSFKPAALDFHGHGESGWRPEGRYDTTGYVSDVETARHALGWPRMVLAGHSLGARIALEYASRHPDRLLAVVAVDFLSQFSETASRRFERTRRRPQPLSPEPEPMLRRFHLEPPGSLLGEEDLRSLARLCLRKTQRGWTWKFDWRSFDYDYEPIWPLLPRVQVPALVVRGENSRVMSRGDLHRVAAEIPGARSLELPKAHHHVPLDAPEELSSAISRFVKSACPLPLS